MIRSDRAFVVTTLALSIVGTAEAQTSTSQPPASTGATQPNASQAPSAPSATQPTVLPSVTVTGNPLGSELFELVQPTSTMSGQDLLLNRSSTIGETLSTMPGV